MKHHLVKSIIVFLGGVLCIAITTIIFPLSADIVDTTEGRVLFQTRCASCHVVDSKQVGLGPSLANIGRIAGSRRKGLSSTAYLFESILEPDVFRAPGSSGQMPVNIAASLTQSQIANIVAFLDSQGGKVDYLKIRRLARQVKQKEVTNQVVSLVAAERGRELYLGRLKCAHCHQLDKHPTAALTAPSLLSAGLHSREYLRESVLHPDAKIVTGYEGAIVEYNGRLVTGRLLQQNNVSISLLSYGNPEIRIDEFPIDELEPMDEENVVMRQTNSLMPNYRDAVTREELDDLVEFLITLR